MKIGVISDTHGSLYFFEMAMSYLKDCDKIIHAGDILYHGPRNDIPGGYNPKELAEKIEDPSLRTFIELEIETRLSSMNDKKT